MAATKQLDLLPAKPDAITIVCWGEELANTHEQLKRDGYVAVSVDVKGAKYTIKARKVQSRASSQHYCWLRQQLERWAPKSFRWMILDQDCESKSRRQNTTLKQSRKRERNESARPGRWRKMKTRNTLLVLIIFLMVMSLFTHLANWRRGKRVQDRQKANTEAIQLLIPKTANTYFQLGVFCGSQVKGAHPDYDQFEIDKAALQKAKEVAPSDEYLRGELMPIKAPTNIIVFRNNVFSTNGNALFQFLAQ